MDELAIEYFANKEEKQELSDEDKLLINSILSSSQTILTSFNLKNNKTWFGDSEATEHLCVFLQS